MSKRKIEEPDEFKNCKINFVAGNKSVKVKVKEAKEENNEVVFRAIFEDRTRLTKIVASIKDLLETTEIYLNEYGMKIESMDKSNLSYISVCLSKNGFMEYKCLKYLKKSISVSSLNTLLQLANPKDNVKIEFSDKYPDEFKVEFYSDRKTRVSKADLRLVNDSLNDVCAFTDNPDAEITMSSKEFQRLIQQNAKLGKDDFFIEVHKDQIKFKVDDVLIKIELCYKTKVLKDEENPGEEESLIHIDWKSESDEPIFYKFHMKYFVFFTKATELSENVNLKIFRNAPMHVLYDFPNEEGYIKFALAPKQETEDEEMRNKKIIKDEEKLMEDDYHDEEKYE